MITDEEARDVLSDVFQQYAEQRPDPAVVLAGVHERIDGRRRRGPGRSVTVLGAAAAVAAVAVGATMLATTSGHRSDPGIARSTVGPRIVSPSLRDLACLDTKQLPDVFRSPTQSQRSTGPVRLTKQGDDSCVLVASVIVQVPPPRNPSSPVSITSIELSRAQSAAAARADGQSWSGKPYYLVVGVSARNAGTAKAAAAVSAVVARRLEALGR